MDNRRERLFVATLVATAVVALGGTQVARAQPFNQGRCGGLICGFGSDEGQPGAPRPPQNCAGLLCDMGTRAFEPPPPPPPPAVPLPPPVDTPPPPHQRPKHRHVAKAAAPIEAPPASSAPDAAPK